MSRPKIFSWLLVFLTFGLTVGGLHAAPLTAQISLRADPPRIPADGSSQVAISIEVLNANGMPAPEGTAVYLITTLGSIVSPVRTMGGFAQSVLTAGNASGVAVVSAMVGSARTTIEIDFTPIPGSAAPGSRFVELEAGDLAYNPTRKIFVGSPRATLTYENLTVQADALEYDVMGNFLLARGGVALRSGSASLEGEALRYELSSRQGRLLRLNEAGEAEMLLLEGDRLQQRPDPFGVVSLWDPPLTEDIQTWVKVQSALIDPRQKVILDHATVYVEDMRIVGLRRHVLDPRQGTALFGDTFGFSTVMGPNLDIPYYYRASGNQIGSLHLTRNRSLGVIGSDTRWSLGIKEEYFSSRRGDGSFSIENITDPMQGIEWRHQFRLHDGSSLRLDASTSSLDDDFPQLHVAGLGYSRSMPGGRLSLDLSGSKFGSSEHYYGSLGYRFDSSRLGSGILLTPMLQIRQSRRYSETEETIIDSTTGEIYTIPVENTGSITSPGVDVLLSASPRELAENLELNASLRTGYSWGLSDGNRGILDMRMGLVRKLSLGHFIRLDYNYSGAPSSLSPTPFRVGRQRANLSGRFDAAGFQLFLNASQEIGGNRLFGSLRAMRSLPWWTDHNGQPLWSVEASHMFSHLDQYRVASSRLAVLRQFGQYHLAICYSPQGTGGYESRPWLALDGFGYTYSGGRHFWLEFMSSGY